MMLIGMGLSGSVPSCKRLAPQYTPYKLQYKSGMFLEVFQFAIKIKVVIKGEICCILYIFLGAFMLFAWALMGRTDGGNTGSAICFLITSSKSHTRPALPPRLL